MKEPRKKKKKKKHYLDGLVCFAPHSCFQISYTTEHLFLLASPGNKRQGASVSAWAFSFFLPLFAFAWLAAINSGRTDGRRVTKEQKRTRQASKQRSLRLVCRSDSKANQKASISTALPYRISLSLPFSFRPQVWIKFFPSFERNPFFFF